jgi:hypothetical protein
MGISFFLKKAIFTFRTAFSLSFAMKFQRQHWLEDFVWRVERVTQKFWLSRCLFPLCISLLCGHMVCLNKVCFIVFVSIKTLLAQVIVFGDSPYIRYA